MEYQYAVLEIRVAIQVHEVVYGSVGCAGRCCHLVRPANVGAPPVRSLNLNERLVFREFTEIARASAPAGPVRVVGHAFLTSFCPLEG